MSRPVTKEIVNSFMLDHNFTRPPTIGEEHEAAPIDRMSNHSSVSGKSEVSTATPRCVLHFAVVVCSVFTLSNI